MPPPGSVPPPRGDEPAPDRQPAPATPRRFAGRPRRSVAAAGALVVAAAVAVFALFGSSNNPTFDPIAQAAGVSSHAPGYRMTMSLSLTSSAFSGPITGYGDAVVDPRDHAASMSFALDFSSVPQVAQVLGGGTMRMDMIADGRAVYVKLPQNLLGMVPDLAAKPWVKMDAGKAAIPGLSSLGSDPTTSDPAQMLQYLRAASDSITNEGRQQVDGVQTTHYQAELSLDRLTANVAAADQATVQQALSKLRQAIGSADLPVDVWIDDHQLIRRTAMSMSLHPAGGPTLQESVVADLSDYGHQSRPTPPPADQVQDGSSLLSGVHISS
jgi:hypothetical protein